MCEYAIKKLKLLLDADSELTEKTRAGLIMIGLPSFVSDRINRKDVMKQSDLVIELGQLEAVVSKPKGRNFGNNKFENNANSLGARNLNRAKSVKK